MRRNLAAMAPKGARVELIVIALLIDAFAFERDPQFAMLLCTHDHAGVDVRYNARVGRTSGWNVIRPSIGWDRMTDRLQGSSASHRLKRSQGFFYALGEKLFLVLYLPTP